MEKGFWRTLFGPASFASPQRNISSTARVLTELTKPIIDAITSNIILSDVGCARKSEN